jgi:hypothetical protein
VPSKTHGMSRTPEHKAYKDAKYRCTNPNSHRWARYGGRGIRFVFSSFEEFYAEIGPKPEPKKDYSLERINVNGNYEPGNCKWATAEEQSKNHQGHAAILRVAELEAELAKCRGAA